MIDLKILIQEFNIKSGLYFDDHFNIKEIGSTPKLTSYRIEGTSFALNRFDIPIEKVKVLRWFNNFWIFLEIKQLRNYNHLKKALEQHLSISLSVFQGEDVDDEKYQLFRAEWDDYENHDEIHAQPHWHITSSQALERTFSSYATDFEKKDFIDLLESEKEKVFDVKKIHFAMNGNWQNNKGNVSKIESVEDVLKWWLGLLNHLRVEIED